MCGCVRVWIYCIIYFNSIHMHEYGTESDMLCNVDVCMKLLVDSHLGVRRHIAFLFRFAA